MTSEQTAAVAVPESVEVAGQEGRAAIKGTINGIDGLRKVRGLTDEQRDASEAPLLAALATQIAELGEPVARGNRLYLTTPAGELVVVDLTPGVLVRL